MKTPRSSRFLPLALSLALAPALPRAQSPEDVLLPGRMGPNALPALPNADPVVPRIGEVELGMSLHLSAAGGDRAWAPTFRLVLPFREVAALEIDGTPAEAWSVSPATRARTGSAGASGVAPGDLRFGARFLVLAERGRRPALGLRFVVKSTTGKAVASRRFTNSPGYVIDLLAGKELGAAGPVRLRGVAKLGFFAWQAGVAKQDDALDYGLTLRAAGARAAAALEWRGYAGFRGHDRPMLAGLTGEWAARPGVRLVATVNRGLTRDAPPWEVRIGAVTGLGPGR